LLAAANAGALRGENKRSSFEFALRATRFLVAVGCTMQFEWTDTQDELYRTVKDFARAELNCELQERRRTHALCERAWRACGRMGLLGLSVPKSCGGGGFDSLTTARVMEAFGEGCEDMGLLFSAAAHLNACAMPIAEHADEDLKRRLLPGLCDGSLIGANAISEANAGSDLAALKTRAVRDGEAYVISGEKSFVTNGAVADVFTVYAITDPSAGYLGISAFVVERSERSVAGKPFEKFGLTTAQTGPVLFDECRVPVGNLLGAEGQGLRIFNSSMAWERTCLFAGYLGQMQRQLDTTVEYATGRKQFGKPIARNQAVSHRIVDMKVRLEAARMLLYRACWAVDRGMPADLYISIAKLAISEAAVTSALDSIRVHGGLGVTMESGVPQALADSVPCTIFSGTSDLQRNIIARELGL
jgi:alkylation response protein AidB-like acyl-CoA dehydrogenase